MTTHTAGQAAAFSDDIAEIDSPFVDHSIPLEERCVDTKTRKLRLYSLPSVYEESLAAEGTELSIESQKLIHSSCKILQVVTLVDVLEDLQDFHVTMVSDFLAERGYAPLFQHLMMRAIFQMLYAALLQSEENDVEIRQSLDGCVGCAWAYGDTTLEPKRRRETLAAPLTGIEIQALLREAYSHQTQLLGRDFSRCTLWFLVLMLLSGYSARALVGATRQDVYAAGGSWWFRTGNAETRIPCFVLELGLLGYLARLQHQGEERLFPAFTNAAGRQTLSRVLGGGRMEEACGRQGGYLLQDIRLTHSHQSVVVDALSALHAKEGFLE